jgi:hypothetical protein
LVRHVTEDEIHPRPISVSVRCRPTGTRLARPTILSTRNPGWRGNRGALAAYPGLSCATPSAYVLPVEQYSEYKVNLIRPCLLRHLDRGKKTTRLKRPCLCVITALTSRKVQLEREVGPSGPERGIRFARNYAINHKTAPPGRYRVRPPRETRGEVNCRVTTIQNPISVCHWLCQCPSSSGRRALAKPVAHTETVNQVMVYADPCKILGTDRVGQSGD